MKDYIKIRDKSIPHNIFRIQDNESITRDAAYSDSKDLVKRTMSDKILKDRSYEIARNRNYDRYQRAFASVVYKVRIQDNESITRGFYCIAFIEYMLARKLC